MVPVVVLQPAEVHVQSDPIVWPLMGLMFLSSAKLLPSIKLLESGHILFAFCLLMRGEDAAKPAGLEEQGGFGQDCFSRS